MNGDEFQVEVVDEGRNLGHILRREIFGNFTGYRISVLFRVFHLFRG